MRQLDSLKIEPQGQGFRPQPMGLCLEGQPRQPQGCLFQPAGPGGTCTLLRRRLSVLPLRSQVRVSHDRGEIEFMSIMGENLALRMSV